MEDECNRRIEGHKEVEATFKSYFEKLFHSSNASGVEIEECLVGLEAKVLPKMNDTLMRSFSKLEVEEALKQMAPLKAPGPDEFGPCFYQNHWEVVLEEVCQAALLILNGNPMDPSFNYAHIALIRKCKDPKKVSEYRPISFCNVMYKLVSKTISNRFKKILFDILSQPKVLFYLEG